MAFNSPVWFNVGIEQKPQCSACFINSVEDTMSSIMDLAKTEAMLFKFGSGAGSNLSTIRSSREKMAGGGTASGPVSFMKGYDAFAGVVKSGGKTRRAAKMVILDAGHPDVEEFIDSKAHEEQKAWALIEAGYDPSFTGEAYGSVFFQNANHSVRVTDAFMQAVVDDGEWQTHAVVAPHEVMDTYKARDLFHKMAEAAHLCGDPGIQYDTTINEWHTSATTDRIHASNPCSEYMFLNDTACNLASLNLMKFVGADGEFDVDAYRFAAKVTITAQEILVDNASYPTPKIEENSHKFRPLGLGYANLGALLMSRGLAYDSDEGRNYAAALTAIMHGEAYKQSSIVARDHGGPFFSYDENREPFLRVINKHRDAAYQIPADQAVPKDMIAAARSVYDEALELGTAVRLPERPGHRPRPDRHDRVHDGLRYDRGRAGHRAHQVQEARRRGLPQDRQPDRPGGPAQARLWRGRGRRDPRLPDRPRDDRGCAAPQATAPAGLRLRVQAGQRRALDPLHGPRPDDGRDPAVHQRRDQQDRQHARGRHRRGDREGLPRGLEARPQGDRGLPRQLEAQPAAEHRQEDRRRGRGRGDSTEEVEKLRKQLAKAQAEAALPHRRRLPAERSAVTHKFDISGHEGYITVGLYPDGQPGEIFLKMAKEGSTVSGLMDSFATTVSAWRSSTACRFQDLVNKFAHVRFEPSGFTGNQEIPIAKSIIDYIFRWLGSRFLSPDEKANLGLIDRTAVVADVPVSSPGSATVDSPVASTSAIADPAPTPASPPPASVAPEPTTDTPKATAVAAEPVVAKAPSLRLPSPWPSSPPTAPLRRQRSRQRQRERQDHERQRRRRSPDHPQPRCQHQGQLPDPGRRPQLHGLRLDHGPQRQSATSASTAGAPAAAARRSVLEARRLEGDAICQAPSSWHTCQTFISDMKSAETYGIWTTTLGMSSNLI